ncbi:MAG TPA: response regulator [Actinomycetota bacterium]|jgi:CheY-like chemotaxis protein
MATILLVDDRAENLRALEAVLEPLGHTLLRAQSADEALACLLREEVALILLDVMMPGLDGFETAELIKQRERTRDIPIIFLTAINQAIEHHLRGYEVGAVDYINKPFDAHILRSKVSVFLDLNEKRDLLRAQTEELRKRLNERDRAQRALVRRTAELARSNRELDQLVQIASHDIREPLDTMAGFLEIIAQESARSAGDDVRLLLTRAIAQVERMRDAIDKLVGSASSGQGLEASEVVAFDKVLDQALDDLESPLAENGARVVRSPLPAVRGDFWQLVELVEVLIEHALKLRGDEAPEVRIHASEGSTEHLISIGNNGVAIDPRDAARRFTVFATMGSPSGGILDVGLVTCRRIIERHGGRIWLESQPGSGSTVFFTLPPAEH